MTYSPASLIKQFAGYSECLFTGIRYPKEELVVLNLHSTPRHLDHKLAELLAFLKSRFQALPVDQVEDYFAHPEKYRSGPYVLLTFDDGLKNNYRSSEILLANGFQGIFFIVPEFIESTDPLNYYRKHIRPLKQDGIENGPDDYCPMSWEELSQLIQSGHRIGNHTLTHDLSGNQSEDVCESEVLASQRIIEGKLGVAIGAFCSPNNSLISVNRNTQHLIQRSHSLHFTTFPGLNAVHRNPYMIMRRNVELYWTKGQWYYALGTWDLRRWRGPIREFLALQ